MMLPMQLMTLPLQVIAKCRTQSGAGMTDGWQHRHRQHTKWGRQKRKYDLTAQLGGDLQWKGASGTGRGAKRVGLNGCMAGVRAVSVGQVARCCRCCQSHCCCRCRCVACNALHGKLSFALFVLHFAFQKVLSPAPSLTLSVYLYCVDYSIMRIEAKEL